MNHFRISLQMRMVISSILCGVLMVWCFGDWHTARELLGGIFAFGTLLSFLGLMISIDD